MHAHRPSIAPAAVPRHGARHEILRRVAAAALVGAGLGAAVAQTAPPPDAAAAPALEPVLEARVRTLVLDAAAAAQAAAGGPAGRVEVAVGRLDPRLRLAPCARIEPYLPDGARAWGRSRVGLRCLEGASRWNVYLPVTVKVFGRALVATTGGAAGALLSAADLTTAEVDLAEDASPALDRPDAAVGRALARALAPGQSLRASHLKARQYFAAGETVTVVAQGAGFSVAGEAQALNNGIEGTPVRVRIEGGRVVTALPIGERRVELGL